MLSNACTCNGGGRSAGGAGTTAGGAAIEGSEPDGAAATGGAGAAADSAVVEVDSAIERGDDDVCEQISEQWSDAEMIREATKACEMMPMFDGWANGVPSAVDIVMRDDLVLTQPLEANEKSALSIVLAGSEARARLEVWGSADDMMCGAVDELLWYGDVEARRLCMEVTPSLPIRRLRLVWRELEPQRAFVAGFSDFTVCAAGICPSDTSGTGRDGEVLEPPREQTRHYKTTNGFFMPERGLAWELNTVGRLLAVWAETSADGPRPIVSGLAYLPWEDELGDGWYCIGEGSTFTPSGVEDSSGAGSLRNLTHLPDCETGDETVTIGNGALSLQVTSSSPELDIAMAQPLGSGCIDRDCEIYFATTDEEGGLGFLIIHMVTVAAVDMGINGPPIGLESAYLVLVRDDGTALHACASGGTFGQDDASASTFQLTGVGPVDACPGDTLGSSSLDFTTESARP